MLEPTARALSSEHAWVLGLNAQSQLQPQASMDEEQGHDGTPQVGMLQQWAQQCSTLLTLWQLAGVSRLWQMH
jgi:hypothetical protein